jgi:hypothetical protein
MSELILIGRSAKGEPIYRDVPSQDELVTNLKETPEWQEFRQRFDTSSEPNNRLLGFLFKTKLMPAYSGDDPTLEDYQRLLRNVIRAGGIVSLPTIKNPDGAVLLEAGQYEFELKPAEPEPVVEEPTPVHRGQQIWSEYRQFSESHSTQDCRNRAKVDAGFASFMRKNYEREARETESTQFQLAGQPSTGSKPRVTPELLTFAEAYRTTPVEKVRQLRSPAFNPLGYAVYVKNIETALAAGLL